MKFNAFSGQKEEPVIPSMTGSQVLEKLNKITVHQEVINDIRALSNMPPNIRNIIINIANQLRLDHEENIYREEDYSTISSGWHFDEDNNLVPDYL
jgi:hypothetical protein